ncbi:hypothetical protein ACP4OV_020679 [Aristida adscensionis]
MLEFIISKAVEENFITIINDEYSTKGSFDVRRLSIQVKSSCYDHVQANMSLTQARSFSLWGPAQLMCYVSKFQLLRVLCLDVYASTDDQYDLSNISNLFQLRYLRTRGIRCKKLLPHLQKLQHLRTLEIFDKMAYVETLQLDIVKSSTTLWHLNIPDNVRLVGGIGRMTALHTVATLSLSDTECIKEISELSNLKDLELLGTYSCTECTYGFLLSSLCKLGTCNLQSLTIRPEYRGFDLRLDFLTCWSPPPRHLRRLHVLHCPFSVVPKWIALLNELSSLEIQVVALRNDGVEILSRLPSLLQLRLIVKDHVPEEGVVICSTAFQNLKEFEFRYKVPCLTFQAGAMPRLRSLYIICHPEGVQQVNGVLVGVEHLGNLKAFKVRIYNPRDLYPPRPVPCSASCIEPEKTHEEKEHVMYMHNLKAAVQKAISKHPGRPVVNIEILHGF